MQYHIQLQRYHVVTITLYNSTEYIYVIIIYSNLITINSRGKPMDPTGYWVSVLQSVVECDQSCL